MNLTKTPYLVLFVILGGIGITTAFAMGNLIFEGNSTFTGTAQFDSDVNIDGILSGQSIEDLQLQVAILTSCDPNNNLMITANELSDTLPFLSSLSIVAAQSLIAQSESIVSSNSNTEIDTSGEFTFLNHRLVREPLPICTSNIPPALCDPNTDGEITDVELHAYGSLFLIVDFMETQNLIAQVETDAGTPITNGKIDTANELTELNAFFAILDFFPPCTLDP